MWTGDPKTEIVFSMKRRGMMLNSVAVKKLNDTDFRMIGSTRNTAARSPAATPSSQAVQVRSAFQSQRPFDWGLRRAIQARAGFITRR